MAKKQLFNYVFEPGVNQNFNAFQNAVELLEKNKEYIRKNVLGFINNQVTNNIAPFQNYTFDANRIDSDTGLILDALIEDVRYNGNVNTRQIASFFWNENIPQISGTREPEVAAYQYMIELINNFIFPNTTVTPVYQTEIDQIKIVGFPAEIGADTRVSDLVTSVTNVIANGLSDLPAEVAPTGKKGKITLVGNYDAKKLLLINNQTFGEIIYAFADPTKLVKAIYQQQPVNETTITLYADTTRMNQTDKIQIFYEDDNQFIQPHPTYQDPVEKLRVSNPESLIDTDFEYSLQGTKWETVELVNNIPSVFSKANEPAFTADEITNVGAVSAGSASASLSPLASGLNGRSGLNLIRDFGPTGYSDDANYIVNLPFNIEFLGTFYSSIYVGTNGYFTFGGGASQFSGFDGNDPPFPHINMLPGDRALMKLYTGTVGGDFIIRWEGSNFGNQSSILHVWELHCSSGSNIIDLHYEQVSSSSTVGSAPVIGDGVNAAYLAESAGTPSAGDSFRVITSTGSARDLQIDVNVDPLVPFFVGQPIVIRESVGSEVDGSYLVKAVNNTRSIIVTARQLVQGSFNTQYTTIYTGGFFTGASIPITSVNRVSGTTNATISFGSPHNFFPGQRLYVVDNNQNDQPYIGSFEIVAINSQTQVEYRTDSIELFNDNSVVSTSSTEVYVRSEAVGIHRFVDGGVQIKPGSPAPNTQIIRQTRKYFRYQSGKGIQFSTGVLFSPTYDILRISVTTNVFDPVNFPFYELNIDLDSEHGFAQPDEYRQGALIELSGLFVASGPDLYNGIYRVGNVVSPKSFTIQIDPSITDFAPGGIGRVGVVEYLDAAVRDGMFDEQNGIYYEYDGKTLSAVIKASTQQLTGTLNLVANSSVVTGVDTKFLTQLAVGGFIVIKGCTYKITAISDDQNLIVQPDIRTQTESLVKFNKVNERKTEIQDFNQDKLDGSGPSGFVFNPLRMQMIFMDYSWYGAGKVRWGMRGLDGTILYCHEEPNNNNNTEAYMRSGNLPGRFEISTTPKQGLLTAGLSSTGTTFEMSNQDAAKFPAKGRASINYEILKYTKGPQSGNVTTFNIDARNEFGLTSNATADSGDTAFSFNGNCGPALSHWGVSVIMDGRFDTDKSYLFTGLNRTAISIGSGQELPIVSIRLAPSVDNGIGRPFGVRNLINRSAVILQQIGVITTGIFEISVRINSETTLFLNEDNWETVGNGSITQYLDHSVVGTFPLPDAGDQVFSFFSEQGDSRFSVTERNIGQIRELGNSILGGNNIYPDGPDILTINARNLTGRTEAMFARISWTESQG